MTARVLQGDALQLLPTIKRHIAAVVTDPPYGCANNCNYKRFTGGLGPSRDFTAGIANDNQPFDPSPWLAYPKVVLWGYQHFADRLPPGTVLVWNKRRDNQLGKFLSDCELAWQKGGKGCYLFNHVWNGFDRASERRQRSLHPSQKPVALFRWVLERLRLKPGDTVLDPYCGSGACGLAALSMGFNYIGIDVEPQYVAIASERLRQASETSEPPFALAA